MSIGECNKVIDNASFFEYLVSIIIDDNVKRIEASALYWCIALRFVRLSNHRSVSFLSLPFFGGFVLPIDTEIVEVEASICVDH